MDFFERQIQAKRRTWIFLGLFVLAFFGSVVGIYLLVAVFMQTVGAVFFSWDRPFWDWRLVWGTVIGVGVFVGTETGRRYWQLRGGGPAVAELLRGELLPEAAENLEERRLHNVVEEMAIAAGIPKPAVYVFGREMGINALAAGFSFDDAMVGVTRGALMHLDRDELQGVIAHEFSHILNGDMRLNVWMICFLHGLVSIHELGSRMVRSVSDEGHGGMEWRSTEGPGISLPGYHFALVAGFFLIAIGYSSYLFARLVQCGLSRQREHLADAAAVQFTRNPDGLAGALKKVAGWSRHGLINHHRVEEAAHVFFVDGTGGTLERILSTHPDLETRVRLLEPHFDGHFPVILDERAVRRSQVMRVPDLELPTAASAPTLAEEIGMDRGEVREMLATIGALEASRLERARRILAGIPEEVREAVRTVEGAEELVRLLLFPSGGADFGDVPQVERLRDPCEELDPEQRLAVAELAAGSLVKMPAEAYSRWSARLDRILDGVELSLFQICLYFVVTRAAGLRATKARPEGRQVYGLGSVWDEVSVVLTALARESGKETERAWEATLFALPPAYRRKPLGKAPAARQVRGALEKLHCLSPGLMRRVMTAAVYCAAADGQLARSEAHLLRALAAALGCPVPPVLPPVAENAKG